MLDEKLYKIIEINKPIPQAKKFIEEAWELGESIINYEHNNDTREHLVEELGDCYTLLRQIQLWYGITEEEKETVMNFKADRTLGRMKCSKKD